MRDGGGRKTAKASFLPTSLCSAGHLPRKGGDRLSASLSQIADVARRAPATKLLISHPAGEMPGRAEAGVPERGLRSYAAGIA
ncbi:hypothetical protein CK220_00880 [Mesorhizobium sp. WSM3860]|nr:hypothetical protein CK220_00880 [Mesorhizobium sp. WSM3860]